VVVLVLGGWFADLLLLLLLLLQQQQQQQQELERETERQISVLGGSVCKTKLQESCSKSGRKEETTRGGREGGRRRGRKQKGMMAWQPQEEGVKEICGLLHESKVPSNDQSRVWQQLQRCNRFPDFNNYLAFILCRAEVSILTHPLPLFSVSFSVSPLLLLSPQNPIPLVYLSFCDEEKKALKEKL
jgi:hypothetical protein